MKYGVKKLPPAEWDLPEAAVWYDEQSNGLADAFLLEGDEAVSKLEFQPGIYATRFSDVDAFDSKDFRPTESII